MNLMVVIAMTVKRTFLIFVIFALIANQDLSGKQDFSMFDE